MVDYSYCDDKCHNCQYEEECKLLLPYNEKMKHDEKQAGEIQIKINTINEEIQYLKQHKKLKCHEGGIERLEKEKEKLIKKQEKLNKKIKNKEYILRKQIKKKER